MLSELHKDIALFSEAINFTATTTGFSPSLIEKDYFSSLVLSHLAQRCGSGLIFKGGTCLAKVHTGFYRLSEDLDFAVPMPLDSGRSGRRQAAARFVATIMDLPEHLSCFAIKHAPMGHNASRQYVGTISYSSVLAAGEAQIKLEVSLREPLLLPWIEGSTNTALLDPISGTGMIPAFPVPSIALPEAMAEKLRAALTRPEPAIRDFYDLAYAHHQQILRLEDPVLVKIVREKLAVPGNSSVDVASTRLAALRRQMDARLRPVLRGRDYAGFDLDRTFAQIAEFASRLEGPEIA